MKKSVIQDEMRVLGEKPEVVFLGQGLINAGRVYGTLDLVPTTKCLEMPVAENLIMGAAVGLALTGAVPIVIFNRFNFVLNALDAIINGLFAIPVYSGGVFKPRVILRIIVDRSTDSFDIGVQHDGDFSEILERHLVRTDSYLDAYNMAESCFVVEKRWEYS